MSACAACGTALADGARFCFSCGTPVSRAAPPAAPSCRRRPLLPGCGAVQADAARRDRRAHPVASRRITSVLFGDLVGFTTLSEPRDQEDVRELLSAYFEECRRIVGALRRHRREVHRRRGDGGLGRPDRPRGRRRAGGSRRARAGQPVAAMGADLGVADLAMRVGIVTGEVAVTIGATQQGMVAGDAVNTAARVQSAAAPGPGLGRRDHPAAHNRRDHLRRRRQPRDEGQGRPCPLWSVRAVVAARRRRPARRRARGAARRPRPRAAAGQGALPRRRGGRPARAAGRRRRGRASARPGSAGSSRSTSTGCRAPSAGTAAGACPTARASRTSRSPRRSAAGCSCCGRTATTPATATRTWPAARRWASTPTSPTPTSAPGWRRGSAPCWASGASAPSHARTCSLPGRRSCDGSVTTTHPVVLVIDDAQHADEGLLGFLEYLLGVGGFPLLRRCCSPDRACSSANPGLATNRRVDGAAPRLRWPTRTWPALLDGLVAGLPDGVRDALVAARRRHPAVRRGDRPLADRPRPRRARAAGSTCSPTPTPRPRRDRRRRPRCRR